MSPESPEGLVLLPLHVQHHINNVLQHLGAGNVPRFGHMAHQEDGNVVWLGNMQQSCGTLPHLWQRQTCFFGPDWTQQGRLQHHCHQWAGQWAVQRADNGQDDRQNNGQDDGQNTGQDDKQYNGQMMGKTMGQIRGSTTGRKTGNVMGQMMNNQQNGRMHKGRTATIVTTGHPVEVNRVHIINEGPTRAFS